MLGMGIAAALFGLQVVTNADVIRIAKQLVLNIDKSELEGTEKTKYVLDELKNFFGDILPIVLEAIIKMAVLDMQNKDGRLAKKIEEMKSAEN